MKTTRKPKPRRAIKPTRHNKSWTDHDLSISEAAKEFHSTPETIRRRLRAAEITHTEGKRYSIYVLHTALVGDLPASQPA